MFPPGIEPGTFCVLGRRDNRYTTETSSTLCLFYGLSRSLPQEELKSCRSSEGVVNKDKQCRVVKFKSHILNSSISWIASISSRDRLVVRTLRCGRSNPGSNPGLGICGSTFWFAEFIFIYDWAKIWSWPRRDSNTQPSDLESDALPLRHGVIDITKRTLGLMLQIYFYHENQLVLHELWVVDALVV